MIFNYRKSIPMVVAAVTVLSAFLLFFFLLRVAAQEKKESPAEPPKEASKEAPKVAYVGSETCQACHEEPAKHLKGSVHHSLLKESKVPNGTNGCESCHGPGSVHAEDPKKENILTFENEAAKLRSDACLACHGKKEALADFRRSAHRFQQIACDQCHATGSAEAFHSMRSAEEMKKTDGTRLCLDCHGEVRMAFSMPFHHRVKEGYLQCIDCHTEHGGFRTGRKGNEQTNETCARCHAEKDGPFLFEHVPARVGGCLSCHFPHGSTNPRMLIRNTVRLLCLECHTNTTAFHNQALERYQNCTVCHTSIHGSNHSTLFFE
jgi:DmsE family decaheme c-type cytochrome